MNFGSVIDFILRWFFVFKSILDALDLPWMDHWPSL
jgi:hypothetical protein